MAGVPTGGKVARTTFTTVDETHSTLELVLSTTSRDGREVSLPISLPAGLLATGLSVSIGGDEPTAASVFTPGGARTIYDRVVAEIKDPALLEWTSDGRVKLSVFPVRRDARATVTIALTTIDETGLHVDRETSLMAAPGQREERFAYGDYWPAHHTEVTVASIE